MVFKIPQAALITDQALKYHFKLQIYLN